MIDIINQRIEDLTGLEMDTAEELQVRAFSCLILVLFLQGNGLLVQHISCIQSVSLLREPQFVCVCVGNLMCIAVRFKSYFIDPR